MADSDPAATQAELRVIDKVIAERIFGWTEIRSMYGDAWLSVDPEYRSDDMVGCPGYGHGPSYPLPFYTTSWDAAGQVVERMRELGWGMVHWNSWPLSSVGRGHAVRFYHGVYPPTYQDGDWWNDGDMGRSFPLACARAALAALGATEQGGPQ